MASVVPKNDPAKVSGFLLLVERRFSANSGRRDRFRYPAASGSSDWVELDVARGNVLRFGPGDEEEIVSFLAFYKKVRNPSMGNAQFWSDMADGKCRNGKAFKAWPIASVNRRKDFEVRPVNVCLGACTQTGHRCVMGRDGICVCVNTDDPLAQP